MVSRCARTWLLTLGWLALGVLPGCRGDSEICDDRSDNDGDGFIDCVDQDCFSTPTCADFQPDGVARPPEGQLPGDCSDGTDNDADGLADCNDDGCTGAPDCANTTDDDDSGLDDDDDATADDDDATADDDDATADDDDATADDDDATGGGADDDDSDGCNDDAFEDNDDQATASPLSPGSYTNLVSCNADDDYYAVTVAAGATIAIDLLFDDDEGDIDLRLMDSSATGLASSTSTNDDESIGPEPVPAAGTYFVRVYLYSDAGDVAGNSYDLSLSVGTYTGDDDDDATADDDDDATGDDDDDATGDDDDATGDDDDAGDDDSGGSEGSCSDWQDGDGDGLIDCADVEDCASDLACSGDDDAGDDDSGLDDDDDALGDDDSGLDDDDDDVGPGCGNGSDDDPGLPDVEVDINDVGCGDGLDGDCDGLFDCEDVDDCCFYTGPGQDCEGSSFCGDDDDSGDDDSGDDDSGDDDFGDDDDLASPPCCAEQTCLDMVADCGFDPNDPCNSWPPPWGGAEVAGDGPDHCENYSAAECASCYDGLDGDVDGGADCSDPEALAVQASGDLNTPVPNCFLIRHCDGDPATDCP